MLGVGLGLATFHLRLSATLGFRLRLPLGALGLLLAPALSLRLRLSLGVLGLLLTATLSVGLRHRRSTLRVRLPAAAVEVRTSAIGEVAAVLPCVLARGERLGLR